MNSNSMNPLSLWRMLFDMASVPTSWVLAYYIRFYSFLPAPKGVPDPLPYIKLLPFVFLIWMATFYFTGFYDRSSKKRSAFLEAVDILQISLLALGVFLGFLYFYSEFRYSRLVILIFATLNPILVISTRSLVRKYFRFHSSRNPLRGQSLIIASSSKFHDALQLLEQDKWRGLKTLGVILIDSPNAALNSPTEDIPLIAKPNDWKMFLEENNIQSLICAVEEDHSHELNPNLRLFCSHIADIKIIPDLHNYSQFSASIAPSSHGPIIQLNDSPLLGHGYVIKRIFDFVLSGLALIMLSPLMLLIAIGVKLSSSGPILYRQERVGMDAKSFDCLKFRSMPVNVENETGPKWATAGENRATTFGAFIRKFSIDELPQLWNVFVGDMSLVGPRPERPYFVEHFKKEIPGYILRHKVKSGITGWAQVNGWRGDTSLEKRIECDLYYIKNWSLALDIKILLMTVREVVCSKSAY